MEKADVIKRVREKHNIRHYVLDKSFRTVPFTQLKSKRSIIKKISKRYPKDIKWIYPFDIVTLYQGAWHAAHVIWYGVQLEVTGWTKGFAYY
ncbi:MAG: hypothetical protein NC089_05905 [Bacteroides sp.]|nr:hypothetical protein [Bacteroides sp.]MCM1548959.1 hypothetical protein [Clostridium sp.]